MYKGHLIHSLLYFEFVELTLKYQKMPCFVRNAVQNLKNHQNSSSHWSKKALQIKIEQMHMHMA